MKIPENKLQEINENIDIPSVYGQYTTLHLRGNRYWGLCPFHSEKTPSFSVDPEKGLYYCFGCQKGGSIFNFLQEVDNLSFVEAVTILAEKAGIQIETGGESEGASKSKAVKEVLTRVAKSFHYILLHETKAKHALDYIRARGISEKTLKDFSIGFAPGERMWLYKFLQKRNFSDELLVRTGLFKKDEPRKAFYANRLMFPIYGMDGKVTGFGGRALSEYGPKYLNSSESEVFKKRKALFGLYNAYREIKRKDTVILVEGYMDVIALYEAGIHNCIAPLGTAFTETQAQLLKRYTANCILLFDNDNAGIQATKKATELCEKEGIHTKVVALEGGKDPSEILEKEGQQSLQKSLKNTINSIEFLLDTFKNNNNINTPEGKEGFIKEAMSLISGVPSAVRRDSYIDIISDITDIDKKTIYQDYLPNRGGIKRKNTQNKQGNKSPHGKQDEKRSEEMFLLLAVSANREYFKNVRTILRVDDFSLENAKKLYIALEECYREDEITEEALLQRLSDESLKNKVVRALSSDEFLYNKDQIIKDSIRSLKRKSIEDQRKKILKQLRHLSSQSSSDEINDLILEKMFLDNELEKLRVLDDEHSN